MVENQNTLLPHLVVESKSLLSTTKWVTKYADFLCERVIRRKATEIEGLQVRYQHTNLFEVFY